MVVASKLDAYYSVFLYQVVFLFHNAESKNWHAPDHDIVSHCIAVYCHITYIQPTLVKRLFDKLLLTYITTVGGSEKFQIFQGEYEVSEKVSTTIRTDDKGDVDTALIFKFRMK